MKLQKAKKYPCPKTGEMRTALEIGKDHDMSKYEVAAYMQYGNPLDGRGVGKRYTYEKDGLDYSAKVIAEMEGRNVTAVRIRLDRNLPLDHVWPNSKPQRLGLPMIPRGKAKSRYVAPGWGYA